MDLEKILQMLADANPGCTPRLHGFTRDHDTALELAKRGFVIVGNIHSEPRQLSIEEIEFMVARRDGNVQ